MKNELWAVYTKEDGLCLVSDYEECKKRFDSEVQYMEDEGGSYGIEDDDCVYLMKVSDAVTAEETDEKWDEENIECCYVDTVEIGDNIWEYKWRKYDI